MSDFSARKTPIITVEPDAESKKFDKTKEKYDVAKGTAKISVGTKPISEKTKSEFAIREGSSLKKLRISSGSSDHHDLKATKNTKLSEPALKSGSLSAKPQKRQVVSGGSQGDIRAPQRHGELSKNNATVNSGLKVSSYYAEKTNDEIETSSVAKEAMKKNDALSLRGKEQDKEQDREQDREYALPDLNTYRLSSVVGAALTAIWFFVAAVYAQFYMGWGEIFSQQPHIIGGFLAGILAPVALLWMIVAHIQRGDEVRQYAIALRDELKTLDFSGSTHSRKQSQSVDITEESKSAIASIHKARAGLRHEIKYLSNISEKTGEQLDKLNTSLTARATKLLDMTQEIEKRTSSLENVSAKKFLSIPAVKGSDADDEIATAALAKTEGLTDKMEERVKALNAVLGKMEGTLGHIESKGSSTADKLSKAVEDSSSNVNALENVISKSIEKLTKATGLAKEQTEDLVTQSSEKIEALNKAGEKTSEKITSVLSQIDDTRAKMEGASDKIEEQTSKSVQAIEKQAEDMDKAQGRLAKRIDEMQLHISEPLTAVNRAVDKAAEKHQEIEETLNKRIEDLNAASDKAMEKTKSIREDLRAQTQEMSSFMGQIAGQSRNIKTMLKDESENLSDQVDVAVDKITAVGTALRGESEKISGVVASSEERIGKMRDIVAQQCIDVVKDTGNVIGEFKTIESLVSDNVKSLLSESTKAKSAVSDVASELLKSAEAVEPIYSKATAQIDLTRERFDNMLNGFEDLTSGKLESLKIYETLFDERLKALNSSADDASKILEKSSNMLGDRVNDIDNATHSAQEKLQDIDNVFKNHVSDIHLTTDQALLKIDNVQKAMNLHYQDLSASVAESLAQMKDVGDQFVKQAEQVQKMSTGAVDGLDQAGNKANERIKSLNKLAKTTAAQMEAMLQKVQTEAEHLLNTSSKTLGQMKQTGEDFANRAKMVESQMKESVQSTKKYGQELDKQVNKVSKTSVRTAEDIENAMSQLAAKLLDVKDVSKGIAGEVTGAHDKLSSETEHFADVSLKAARVVEEAANSYVRQSGVLSKATTEAAAHIQKVKEGDWRAQRDAFLNATRFVLESLHSLSVDLTRAVHGDIQEKSWKAYQRGDIAIFTRRLIENRAKLPHDKMAAKYENDTEFRTYVNRFIREFEDLYEQAGTNDYGELISATFASSDVAGLYDILCDVAGRKSLIKRQARRAV